MNTMTRFKRLGRRIEQARQILRGEVPAGFRMSSVLGVGDLDKLKANVANGDRYFDSDVPRFRVVSIPLPTMLCDLVILAERGLGWHECTINVGGSSRPCTTPRWMFINKWRAA